MPQYVKLRAMIWLDRKRTLLSYSVSLKRRILFFHFLTLLYFCTALKTFLWKMLTKWAFCYITKLLVLHKVKVDGDQERSPFTWIIWKQLWNVLFLFTSLLSNKIQTIDSGLSMLAICFCSGQTPTVTDGQSGENSEWNSPGVVVQIQQNKITILYIVSFA